MFERFTDPARRVVVLAQEEARMLGHGYIGTEHLLLGLIHEGDGIAAQVLEGAGLTLDRARETVEQLVDTGPHARSGHIPFTPRAKTALELSLREAMQLRDKHIGTEHLLLGVLQEGGGVAIQVIERLGSDAAQLRGQVLELAGVKGRQGPDTDVGREEIGETPARKRWGALVEENAQLHVEVDRLRSEVDGLQGEITALRARLRQHGIDPSMGDAGAGS